MTVKENWDDEEVNEKMNVFPALEYNGFDSLNWRSLIIRHEGEDASFSRFFEYFHMMDMLSTNSSYPI